VSSVVVTDGQVAVLGRPVDDDLVAAQRPAFARR
jgi:hypothetical protein